MIFELIMVVVAYNADGEVILEKVPQPSIEVCQVEAHKKMLEIVKSGKTHVNVGCRREYK